MLEPFRAACDRVAPASARGGRGAWPSWSRLASAASASSCAPAFRGAAPALQTSPPELTRVQRAHVQAAGGPPPPSESSAVRSMGDGGALRLAGRRSAARGGGDGAGRARLCGRRRPRPRRRLRRSRRLFVRLALLGVVHRPREVVVVLVGDDLRVLHLVRADRPAHGATARKVPSQTRPGPDLRFSPRPAATSSSASPRPFRAPWARRSAARAAASRGDSRPVRGAAAEAPAAHDALLLRPGLGGLEPGGAPLARDGLCRCGSALRPPPIGKPSSPTSVALALDELVVPRDVVHLSGRRPPSGCRGRCAPSRAT